MECEPWVSCGFVLNVCGFGDCQQSAHEKAACQTSNNAPVRENETERESQRKHAASGEIRMT